MSISYKTLTPVVALFAASTFLAGCNPATEGWSSVKGNNLTATRVAAAKNGCNYDSARARALTLLDAGGKRNSQRASRIMGNAERCMRKYGIKYRSHSAYAVGQHK